MVNNNVILGILVTCCVLLYWVSHSHVMDYVPHGARTLDARSSHHHPMHGSRVDVEHLGGKTGLEHLQRFSSQRDMVTKAESVLELIQAGGGGSGGGEEEEAPASHQREVTNMEDDHDDVAGGGDDSVDINAGGDEEDVGGGVGEEGGGGGVEYQEPEDPYSTEEEEEESSIPPPPPSPPPPSPSPSPPPPSQPPKPTAQPDLLQQRLEALKRLQTSPPPPAPQQAVAAASAGAGAGDGSAPKRVSGTGGACSSHAGCGRHGMCAGGRCLCAILYSGKHCEGTYSLPRHGHLHKFKARFEGAITMNKKDLQGRSAINVFLPGKESDKDGGHRTLGRVTPALRSAVPESDIFLGRVYPSCAVVGSSGILLHYERGAEIDSHDMIMRFNSAPTKGFERHVGSRTSHRITNTQNWAYHEFSTENLLVHMRSQSSLSAYLATREGAPRTRMFAFDTDFVEYVATGMDFMATSGLYGIIIALQNCAKVDLYGFQVSVQHGAASYHYYNECDQPANAGRDDSEWHIVKAFVDAGVAKFAEPCVMECHTSKDHCEACKQTANFPRLRVKPVAELKKKCPRCSFQFGGCRPAAHWAFSRRNRRAHGGGGGRHG